MPEYSVSTTLLIRDDNNTQMGAENLLEGLEIFSGKKNYTVKTMKKHMPELMEVYEKIFGKEPISLPEDIFQCYFFLLI